MRVRIVGLLLIVIIFMLLHTTYLLAQGKDNVAIQNRLDRIENSLSEVRRDQLNYKLEKDLLKEAFSSNYQTINIVLAIVLGVFTIIGVLGIRDISATRREYLAELERINSLRKDLEIKFKEIAGEQEKVKKDYVEIIKINEEQSRKIKVLELQEKIFSLVKARNNQRALEYLAVALSLDPNNTLLLNLKGVTLTRLNDPEGAISIYSDVLKQDPDNRVAITNLLELFLITKRIKDFEELYSRNRSWVDQYDEDGCLSMYFDLLKNYQLGQQGETERLTKEYIEKLSAETRLHLKWDFGDVSKFLESQPDSRPKKSLMTFLLVIQGNMAKKEALNEIEIHE